MTRVSLMWTAAVATMLCASAMTRVQGQAREPGKIFISVDMEGITGVVQPAQLGPTGFEYSRAREWMTGEAKAAIEGARAGGATSFVLADSHGNAQNVLIDQLPEDVRVVRGFPRPLSMMQGIDETFAAAIFIGYHASEMTADAVRGHTFSSAKLLGVTLNGVEMSEGMFNAAIAGHFGVPVVFISGDRKAVEQLQKVVPAAGGAIVKEPLGYHSAITVTPAKGQAMIREGVRVALVKRTLNSTCTDVVPGANGPLTVTRVPSIAAAGDEPSRICAPTASGGSWSTNGPPMSTRVRAELTISSR